MRSMSPKRSVKRFWTRYSPYIAIVAFSVSVYVIATFDEKYYLREYVQGSIDHITTTRPSPRALIIHEKSQLGEKAIREINSILRVLRVSFETRLPMASFADLGKQTKFNVVIILGSQTFEQIEASQRGLLKDHCKVRGIGILVLDWDAENTDITLSQSLTKYPISNLTSYNIDPQSKIWRITKDGGDATDNLNNHYYQWVAFKFPKDSPNKYEPFAYARVGASDQRHIVGVLDAGGADGVRKVYVGNTLTFWLHHPVLMDALFLLTGGLVAMPLRRTVIIDIDDAFIGKDAKLKKHDVQALVAMQRNMKSIVRDFKFNLGFCGDFYKSGAPDLVEGDLTLIEHKDEFLWFPHTYHHVPAQDANLSFLEKDMRLNKAFAEKLGLPVTPYYSVAPRHSGIYPIIDALYTAWRNVWDIRVTSVPTLWTGQEWGRMHTGFEYKGIKVLPRDTLRMSSKTVLWSDVGGREKADYYIRGGEHFLRTLYYLVLVIMTHTYNFSNDQVALTMITETYKFVRQWTHLDLVTQQPLAAADEYFAAYPEERPVVWQNPCRDDVIHLYKFATKCRGFAYPFPDIFVLGPDRTGTTALWRFLQLHPEIQTNNRSDSDPAGDVHFFSHETRYQKGIEWYMDQFPNRSSSAIKLLEKSSSYFANPTVPSRLLAVAHSAHFVVLLEDPARRAYSFYQSRKGNGDPVANQHTFYDIISSKTSEDEATAKFRHDCLHPGLYATHLKRWLEFFPLPKIKLVDSDQLRNEPVDVLRDIQNYLQLKQISDYSNLIRLSEEKGFFCVIRANGSDCLDADKGRSHQYSSMTNTEREFLVTYYQTENEALHDLLMQYDQRVPTWLNDFMAKYSKS